VGTFSWSANVIWEARRGRSWYRQWPFNVAVTMAALVLITLVLLALVLTGPVADAVGDQLGIGATGLQVWDVAKWPMIVAVVTLMISGLYYIAPERQAPQLALADPRRRARRCPVGRRDGPVRPLHRPFRLLLRRPTARSAPSSRSWSGVADQHRDPAGYRARLGDRT